MIEASLYLAVYEALRRVGQLTELTWFMRTRQVDGRLQKMTALYKTF